MRTFRISLTHRSRCGPLSCRFAGGAIGAAHSFGGCSSPRTSWVWSSRSLSRTCCLVAARAGDRVTPGFEYVAFLLAIPVWILLLRLEGLYDRDEERTDHSTVDDIVGVFRSVTIGVWIFALFGVATNLVQPVLARLGVFWLARRRPDPDPARRRADALPPPARLRRRTPSSSARGTSASSSPSS